LKRFLNILLFLISGFTLCSQQLLIVDSSSAPVNAKVVAINQADKKTSSGITVNGYYNLPAEAVYKIKIHAIGFENFETIIPVSKSQLIRIVMKIIPVAIDDVVVTAQLGAKTPKNSVIPVKVIDARKIYLMGAQNLNDVLTNEPGMRLSQDNILGSSISVQGMSGENVKILIDGVPVIGRQNGNIDLSQINLANIERIEIIEGPMSVNYGTNAIGGVINIITKKGKVSNNSIGLKTYYETIGTYNFNLTANTHFRNLIIQPSFSRNFFDGWKANEPYEAIPLSHIADTNRVKTWKPKEQYNGSLDLSYKIKSWDLRYKSGYFNEYILNLGMPRFPYYEDAFDDIYRTRRIDNVFMANKNGGDKKNLNIQLAGNLYQRIKNTYYNDLTTLNRQLTENPSDQDTTRFTLYNIRISRTSFYKNINYELGIDLNQESSRGQRIAGGKKSQGDYAVYAVGEFSPLDNLTLRGGFRAAYNSAYHAPVLPSINTKWYINSKNVLRFSYARGFKAPALKELYFYFVDFNHDILGNTQLKAEHSNSYNTQFSHTRIIKNCLVRFELKGFYNHISDLITLAQIQGISYTYINVGLYKTKGLQAAADLSYKNLKLNLGINYTGRYNQLSTVNNHLTDFTYSPEYFGNIGYFWTKYKLSFTLFYKFNGKIPAYFLDASNNIILQQTGYYHWADFTVNKSLLKTLNIGGGIKNIFNVQNITAANGTGVHQSGNTMPVGAGRFYFLSLAYTLQK